MLKMFSLNIKHQHQPYHSDEKRKVFLLKSVAFLLCISDVFPLPMSNDTLNKTTLEHDDDHEILYTLKMTDCSEKKYHRYVYKGNVINTYYYELLWRIIVRKKGK